MLFAQMKQPDHGINKNVGAEKFLSKVLITHFYADRHETRVTVEPGLRILPSQVEEPNSYGCVTKSTSAHAPIKQGIVGVCIHRLGPTEDGVFQSGNPSDKPYHIILPKSPDGQNFLSLLLHAFSERQYVDLSIKQTEGKWLLQSIELSILKRN